MFEGYAMIVLADMPILKASKLLRCGEKALTKILRYWVKSSVDKDDLSKVEQLSIDETSFKRGQSYVTVVIDAKERRVIDVEPDRGEKQIIDFSYKLEEKGGDCQKIQFVSSNLSPAYRAGIQFCFSEAKHTVDKFHVKKLLLDALEEVRKSEQNELHLKTKVSRKLLMIPESKQTEQQRIKVAEISRQYKKTGRAYRMVQSIDEVYRSPDIEEATRKLNQLYSWMRKSRLEPMKRVALTLRKYFVEILNIFRSRMTNAISEGINSMIQAAKRKARGYHTFEGFSSMIYLIAAKLQLECQNPLRFWE